MKDSKNDIRTGPTRDTQNLLASAIRPVITEIYSDSGTKTGPIRSGDVTDDAKPRFTGTAAPNSLVEIHSRGVKLGEGYADENGHFSFLATTPFLSGYQEIFARTLLDTGYTYSATIGIGYSGIKHPVDADQPVEQVPTLSRPVIEGAYDNRNGEVLIEGRYTEDTMPLLKGTADPLAIIYITNYIGQPLGSVQADAEGHWALEIEATRGGGPFQAIAVDAQNPASVSYKSETIDILVGQAPEEPTDPEEPINPEPVLRPAAPVIESAYDNVEYTGDIRNFGITDDAHPLLSGTAEPNSLVKIYSAITRQLLGEGYADENGRFSFEITESLNVGVNALYATSTVNGVESRASNLFDMTFIDRLHVPDPFIPPYAYEAEVNEPFYNTIGDGETTSDFTPMLEGKANPFATIVIRLNGKVIDEVQANYAGVWHYEPTVALEPGENVFTFAGINDGIEQISDRSFTLNITISARITHAEDDVDEPNDNMSSGWYTDDNQPTLRGVGTPNGIVKIYTENGLLGSTQINEKGEWQFTPEAELAPGIHNFRPEVEYPGVETPVSGHEFQLEIAAPRPLTPQIQTVYDNEIDQGWLYSGTTTDDATPTFSGNSYGKGMTIIVRDNGNVYGQAEVDRNGQWSWTPEPALDIGSHSLTFEIVDSKGNVHVSESFNLQITTPVLTQIVYAEDNVGDATDPLKSGASTDDETPTLHGTSAADMVINIYYKGYYFLGSAKSNANGDWSFTPRTPLSAGAHEFYARPVNEYGTELAAGPTFTLDIAPVVPPVEYFAPTISSVYDYERKVNALNNGDITDDKAPTFSGEGMPGSIIEVRHNGKTIGEIKANDWGNWNFKPKTALEPGEHTFSFVTVGADGQEYASEVFGFKVINHVDGHIDFAEDNVGDLTDPLISGSRTDDTTPTLNGVGTPNGIVTIYSNWNPIGSVQINADGKWSFTPSTALKAGSYSFNAVVTSPDGTQLNASSDFKLDIEIPAPPIDYYAPTINSVYDDEGRHNNLHDGSITDDTKPRFSGRGMPDSTIEVRHNGEKVGEASVNWMGNWSFTPNEALKPGNHTFSFVTVGADGQEYASETFSLEIITHIEGRIDLIEDNAGDETDTLLSGARTDDTTPTLKGVGTPNGTVEIYNGYDYLGSVEINADGEWSFTPRELQDGTYSFHVVVTSPDGTRLSSSPKFDLIIAQPVDYFAPVVDEAYDNEGHNNVLSSGGITDDTTPRFEGRAVANSTIEVHHNGEKIADVQVNRWGNWSFTPNEALKPGNHTFSFVTLGEDGTEYASEAFDLEIITHVLGRIDLIEDNAGDETDTLLSGARTDDTTPTLKGVGTPNGTVEIYDGWRYLGSADINADGEWSFTPDALQDGSHSFRVTVTSPDGTVLAQSPAFDLTIAQPVDYFAPTISSVYDYERWMKELSSGDFTDDSTPTFTGHGVTGSTIEVHHNGKSIGEIVVRDWGTWTYTPSPALKPGEHNFSFVTVGENGEKYASEAFSLKVISHVDGRIDFAEDNVGDLTDPLISGSRTDDTTPTLNGVGTPNGIVTIYSNWNPIGSVQINADGEWSFTPSTALKAGSYSFNAVVTSPDGTQLNASPDFKLDVEVPAPPIDYYAPSVSGVEDNVGRDSYISRGGITDDDTPTFSGRGVRNSLLEVRIDGKTMHTVEVNEAGRWSWTPSPALKPGSYDFTFVSVDDSGTEFASEAISLEIITQTIGSIVSADDNVGSETTSLIDGSRTDDSQPTLRGTGTANGTVEIFYKNQLLGHAAINEKGEWHYTPQSPLSNGSHEFYAVVTGPDGTRLDAGPIFNLTIDAEVVYFAPVIDGVVDDAGLVGRVYNGETTDDATPTFFGQGVADSTLEVYVNDEYYGEAKTDPWGIWIWTPSKPLGEGEQTFTFITTDDKGQEYRSEDFMLLIGLPTSLAILSADDDVGTATDTLFTGSTTDDTQPTLRGTGMPNAIMEIFTAEGVLGSTKIKADGNWSFTPDEPLPAGTHEFKGMVHWAGETNFTQPFELTITPPETTNAINLRSLLQDGDAPLFAETDADLRTTQPVEPTAFVPASGSLTEEWENTPNHY